MLVGARLADLSCRREAERDGETLFREQLRRLDPDIARTLALIVGALDCVAFFGMLLMALLSPGDQATKALGIGLGWVILLLFALTAAPAIALAWFERVPRTALALALAFPLLFMLLYGGLTIAFAL